MFLVKILFWWSALICPINAIALISLESLHFSNGKDLFNYNLMDGVYSENISVNKSTAEFKKLVQYQAIYQEGLNLKFSCDYQGNFRYPSSRSETNAKRSVASTLQYLGLDLSLKAIVEYSKLLDLSSTEFDNIVENLLQNNCSQNLSVVSIKLLRNKFHYYYQKGTGITLPSVKDNEFFSSNFRKLTNSLQAKENEFNITLKNFRAFCSWGGDTDDYRLMAPYISNPFLMSIVFNHLLEKETMWDNLSKSIFYQKKTDAVRVACDDLLCRKHAEKEFTTLFPRMLGSTNLNSDLENLYCGHFQHQTYREQNSIEQIKTWIKQQRLEDPYLEVFQFLSLYTGVPDLLIASETYQQVQKEINRAIELKWQHWAESKANQLVSDLLYEEPLQIDLVTKRNSDQIKKGEFELEFQYTQGELDRVLRETDKIYATFYLEFPRSYLGWIRKAYLIANNQSRYAEKEALHEKFAAYIKIQLDAKKEHFLIPMWNENMSKIMASELISQLSFYNGSRFKELGHDKMKVPVKLRYGLFALKYLRGRFKEKYRSSSLTYGH